MIVDAHVHISDNGSWFNTDLKADPLLLLERMDTSEISRALILPTFGNCSNETVAKVCNDHPERFIGFATFDVHNITKTKEDMKAAKSYHNLKGIKLHPRFQKFSPVDEKVFPVYEKAEEFGWPIIFDGLSNSPVIPMRKLTPDNYDLLTKRFKELKIIIAHLGGQRYWDAYWIARANKNVYLDISYIFEFYQSLPHVLEEFRYIMETLDEKLIYGSDFPSCDPKKYFDLVNNNMSHLSSLKKDNILSKNISKILDLSNA